MLSSEDEDVLPWTAISLCEGGTEAVSSACRMLYRVNPSMQSATTLLAFFLAMAMHPEVQLRAQAELDSVMEIDQLPSFADRPRLPYIAAVQKEILRWAPVAPLGIPHSLMDNDEYHGHFIPKGATVIQNIR